jgi:hypothetical protein
VSSSRIAAARPVPSPSFRIPTIPSLTSFRTALHTVAFACLDYVDLSRTAVELFNSTANPALARAIAVERPCPPVALFVTLGRCPSWESMVVAVSRERWPLDLDSMLARGPAYARSLVQLYVQHLVRRRKWSCAARHGHDANGG